MSKRKKNAGEGYGYMFSGAFAKKADAVKKEKTRKGSFIKSGMTKQGFRYFVMTPRTNPRKTKRKKPERANPSELLVMGANPHGHEREITVPPGTTITIRTNPENPPEHYSSAQAQARGASYRAPGLIQTARQRRVAGMVRRAAGTEGARLARSYKRHRASGGAPRGTAKVFHELYGRNPEPAENPICGARIGGGEVCTRKPGHKGPHLPQGATMRPRSRLRSAWKPNPSAAALHESFTGQSVDQVRVLDEPCIPRGDYGQIGELLALYVKPLAGGQVKVITCNRHARPIVLAAESGRQIYFAGGDQDLAGSLPAFGARDRGGNVYELGEARRIDYKQRKEHLPDPDGDEWKHEFGEENGVRPIALFDATHRRILLEGGDYRIRPEGIIN